MPETPTELGRDEVCDSCWKEFLLLSLAMMFLIFTNLSPFALTSCILSALNISKCMRRAYTSKLREVSVQLATIRFDSVHVIWVTRYNLDYKLGDDNVLPKCRRGGLSLVDRSHGLSHVVLCALKQSSDLASLSCRADTATRHGTYRLPSHFIHSPRGRRTDLSDGWGCPNGGSISARSITPSTTIRARAWGAIRVAVHGMREAGSWRRQRSSGAHNSLHACARRCEHNLRNADHRWLWARSCVDASVEQ